MLCADLKKKNYVLQKLVKKEDNYYEDLFKDRVKRGVQLLKKLRPYVLEYTKEWTSEMKQRELNNKEIEKVLLNGAIRKTNLPKTNVGLSLTYNSHL